MRKIFLFLATILTSVSLTAQQVRPATSAEVYHELQQLRHLTSVLYVAAHPDDENTRLLAWLVNEKNIRTAYLSLTRGDGGQNILGSEQGPALGLIRTHELMEARKLDGAGQFFSRAIDFGFSKNKEETFNHWNEYLLTNDVVWVMRKFRPDVVICRFPPDARAGHGQHAASAVIAAKAFKLAGDKMQFTEHLHYYSAWQPKRILFNSYRFGDRNTTAEDQLKLTVGQYMPQMGMGAGELAGLSRSVHKSQGAGTPSVAGVQTEYFKLVDGDTLSKALWDGIDITWNRVARPDIGEEVQSIIAQYDYKHPDESLPALIALRKKIATVNDDYWRKEKLEEIDNIILHCTGLLAELYTNRPQAIAGASLPFTLHVIARGHNTIRLTAIKWIDKDTAMNLKINTDSLLSFTHVISVPAGTPLTQPYWLANAHMEEALFSIPADTLAGLPETPNNLNATITLKIGGEYFDVKVPLSYKKLDPVKGDVVEGLRIVPDVTVSFTAGLLITQPDGSVATSIRLHSYKDVPAATLTVGSGKLNVTVANLHLRADNDTIVPIFISAAQSKMAGTGDYFVSAQVTANGKTYDKEQHIISYSHIPTLQYFTDANAKVLRKNWKCTVKKIAYVEGAGDYIPTFLRLAGLQVDVLKEADLTDAARLKQYDAIITGVRSVNVEKRMAWWMPVLLNYVQNGGTLVMQYNTLQDMSTTKLGPYPFTLTDKRVTEENAAVTFLHPEHKLLNYPNKITQNDMTDWVQERGLYFATKWDAHYTPLFRMNDAGEDPQDGSTLYTPYGKGQYIYTSLSFFRQLPAGNKGAIRLLMNMLSAGK
ncbi:MAG: PIG-L family deacetylase [Taibaiella sp.]|nr:PIG-L family deacetylase [Taibaiella sp.]